MFDTYVFDTFDAILLVRPETWWDIDPERVDGRVLPVFLEEDDNDQAYS